MENENAHTDETSDQPDDHPADQTDHAQDTSVHHPRLERVMRERLGFIAAAAIGLLVLAAFYTLYLGATLFLPLVIAVLLNFLFSPVVRFFERLHLPPPLGAAVVMLALLGILALALYNLSGPAADWIERAPEVAKELEDKLRGLRESVQQVGEATREMGSLTEPEDDSEAQTVRVQPATARGGLLSQTQSFLAGTAVVFFLLYFLLAAGDLFLRKFVHVLPLLRRKKVVVAIAHQIEEDLSTYLFTYTLINLCLGTVVGFVLFLLGMPNPVLWGLMVAALNYIPYLGPLVGVTIVGLVAFTSFESIGQALLAPGLYFLINALEGNLITPMIMGRRLQMNPVAIFVSLTFWGWIWGIPGALLAVPLLLAFKIVCDHVIRLRPLGEFIGR